MPTLGQKTRALIRDGWARQLGVPTTLLAEPGLHVVAREGARGAVVLELGEVVVMVAPPRVTVLLRALGRERLMELREVVAALDDPSARPIGSASLSYADRQTLSMPDTETLADRPRDDEIVALLAEVTPDERDESAVADMPLRWLLRFPDGSPAAVAGYEPWHDRIAQLGLLVHPAGRRKGLGRRVASVAAAAALDAGLVPQWRCRIGNVGSARVAEQLGFVRVGRQLAVALDGGPV